MTDLASLSRSQRYMLKRAWGASERRPLHVINGPKKRMQIVAEQMIDLGLVRKVDGQFFALVLTAAGFDLAQQLMRQGWPDTEKKK